jgi:hypothetical protein
MWRRAARWQRESGGAIIALDAATVRVESRKGSKPMEDRYEAEDSVTIEIKYCVV